METLRYLIDRFNVTEGRSPHSVKDFNRTAMAKLLHELDFKVGAEIGVAQGNHAKMLCEYNPQLKLYAIDVWDRYDGFNEYTDRIDRYYREAVEKLTPFNVEFIKKFSMDAVKDFADGSLDFVYIDGAHDFKNVVMDVCEWAKKVRVGGIVFGHDYKRRRIGDSKYPIGVKDAIQAYCYYHAIDPWFVLENNLRDEVFGSDNPAWLFVRQEKDCI